MVAVSIFVLLIMVGALFYHRVNLPLSAALLVAYFALMGAGGLWSYWLLPPLLVVLAPLVVTALRQKALSAPALRVFKKVMPAMSNTEKEAINAGTTWWEGELFRGAPDWKMLHNYPQPTLIIDRRRAGVS